MEGVKGGGKGRGQREGAKGGGEGRGQREGQREGEKGGGEGGGEQKITRLVVNYTSIKNNFFSLASSKTSFA